MSVAVIPERFAIMAVDPGGVTGASFGLFDTRETVADTVGYGGVSSREVEGTATWQGLQLCDLWQEFYANVHLFGSVPAPAILCVVEGFALRTKHAELDSVKVLSSWATANVCRCPAIAPQWREQTAADAKRVVTGDRLKGLGLWVRGSEHRRDSNRHLALGVAKVLEGRYG